MNIFSFSKGKKSPEPQPAPPISELKKSVADLKQEVKTPAPEAPKQEPVKKPATKKKSGDLSHLLGAISHFGMGKERSRFIQNLAILLTAGLNVTDALSTILAEVKSKPMRKIIKQIMEEVSNGSPLWRSMDNQHLFAPYELALIRIGEESGSLSKNMAHLAEQQEKDHGLKQKVKMAMIYPTIVLSLTIVVTLGLAWFVLPKLVGVLLSLHAKLPLVTRIIIWIANFFSAHGSVAVPSFGVVCVVIVILCKYTPLKGPTQKLIFHIPGVGALAKQATIARFGVILGSLLRAGVPLVDSIHSLAEVTDTVAYKKFYFKLADEVNVGNSFATSFGRMRGSDKLLPVSVQQLVVTGEKSGALADMLLKIADIYEKKAEETAHKLPVILEPMLLFFIGGVVGTVAFAIIVPIYSVVGSIGR
jgi:type IV pilus assembly protein PilC